MKAKAAKIQNHIDTIIGAIDPKDIPGPINWGDLCCVEVGVTLTDSPIMWTAVIEEASPDATDLAAHIHNELFRLGHDVYVRCEW
jgi:hypothetical protein